MHGPTLFPHGIDHTCDADVSRWFTWRFPSLELRRFMACREWPYKLPHHIIEMEGSAHVFVNLGILTKQLLPGPIRRSRSTHQFKVQRLTGERVRVSMLIWQDAPLDASHPLAKLCPSRWPIVDEPAPSARSGHLTLIKSARPRAL